MSQHSGASGASLLSTDMAWAKAPSTLKVRVLCQAIYIECCWADHIAVHGAGLAACLPTLSTSNSPSHTHLLKLCCALPTGSFLTWAADIQHLLDSLHIQQAVMLGMSGGGPYACACARYLPAHTAALVTVAGMLATNDPAHADLLQQMHWMDKLHSHIIDNKLAHNAVLLASLPIMALSPYPLKLIGKLPGAVQQLVCRVLTSAGWAEADRQLLLQQPQLTWQLLPELMAQSVAQGAAGWGWDMKLTSSAWSFDPK